MGQRRKEPRDEALREALQRVERAAERICRGVELTDPDRVDRDLGLGCARVRDALASLMTDPSRPGEVDLFALVNACAREVLAEVGFPVRLLVEGGGPLVVAGVLGEGAASVLHRVLRTAAEHAGPGGEIAIAPGAADGAVLCRVAALPSAGRARLDCTVRFDGP